MKFQLFANRGDVTPSHIIAGIRVGMNQITSNGQDRVIIHLKVTSAINERLIYFRGEPE